MCGVVRGLCVGCAWVVRGLCVGCAWGVCGRVRGVCGGMCGRRRKHSSHAHRSRVKFEHLDRSLPKVVEMEELQLAVV